MKCRLCRLRDRGSIDSRRAPRQPIVESLPHSCGGTANQNCPAEIINGTGDVGDCLGVGSLGTEAGRFDQAHLIASGGEFSTLVALHDHATT